MASPNVVKVVIMLEELAMPWRFTFVKVHAGEQFSPAFKALNPNSKTPVIVDEATPEHITVFESGAILIYLAEKAGALLPRAEPARSSVLQWLMFQMASVGPAAGQTIHFTFVTDYFKFLEHREDYAVARFTHELERIIGVVDQQLSDHPYIAGAAYSIADVALFPWIRTVGGYIPQLIDRPHVKRWLEEVSRRPAVTRALAFLSEVTAQAHVVRRAATPEQLDRYFGRVRLTDT